MMKSTYRKIFNRCSVALICVLLVVSNVQGVVFCEAEDGHASIELISSACCESLNTSISSEESKIQRKVVSSSNEDSCGPCEDTLISAEAINLSEKTTLTPYLIATIPQVGFPIAQNYDFSDYQLESALHASGNPCLASLRTIILIA